MYRSCVSLCAQLLSLVHPFVALWTVAHQTPLSMKFSRQEYWRGLPFSTPGNISDPGIKPTSASPALTDGFFTIAPLGKPHRRDITQHNKSHTLQTLNQHHNQCLKIESYLSRIRSMIRIHTFFIPIQHSIGSQC